MGYGLLFNMDNLDAWIFGLSIYLTGVSVTSAFCPPSWETAAEYCIDVESPEEDTTGSISYEDWLNLCQQYERSIFCMNRYMGSCLESGGDVDDGISIRDKMLTDHNQICSSNNTFQRYKDHSECFTLVANDSAQCQDAYVMDSAYEYMDTDRVDAYDYTHEDDENSVEHDLKLQICGALQTLLDCINRVVMRRCGPDAMELYARLLLSQVPSHVTETCSEISSSSSGVFSASTLLCIPILLHVCVYLT